MPRRSFRDSDGQWFFEDGMNVLSIRPKVAELVFQLYGRPLHPELFKVFCSRKIEHGPYEASVNITSAGHIVAWRHQGITLTEVATGAHMPLPQKRRLLSYRLQGERNDQVDCRGGSRYLMSFQLEKVQPDIFWNYQNDLFQGEETDGLLYRFESSGRMALGAISYIHIDVRMRSLRIQAFHTFPDDYAIVKSQSVFKLPSKAGAEK